jgi:hypothetical protein
MQPPAAAGARRCRVSPRVGPRRRRRWRPTSTSPAQQGGRGPLPHLPNPATHAVPLSQEEERERRMDFVPEESAINVDSIEVRRLDGRGAHQSQQRRPHAEKLAAIPCGSVRMAQRELSELLRTWMRPRPRLAATGRQCSSKALPPLATARAPVQAAHNPATPVPAPRLPAGRPRHPGHAQGHQHGWPARRDRGAGGDQHGLQGRLPQVIALPGALTHVIDC